MRILYHLPYANGTGADYWIYIGWRDAFTACGHEFSLLTAQDDIYNRVQEFQPHIFLTAVDLFHLKPEVALLKKIRKLGVKIFMGVYLPLPQTTINTIREEEIADIYFGEREIESMVEFEQKTGRRYHLIPNAANKFLHFPTRKVKKYDYDIVYLGAYLRKKREFFEKVLFPLKKKYRVGIFGPYWSISDNILRGGQKFFRNVRYYKAADFLNRMRISIPSEEENQLYSSAKICLNVHEREDDGSQPHYILNQRTFKIPACGGFEICDTVPALRRYFSDDEVVMASDPQDWFNKTSYYISHNEERQRISQKGSIRALRDHTYHKRVEMIINIYEKSCDLSSDV